MEVWLTPKVSSISTLFFSTFYTINLSCITPVCPLSPFVIGQYIPAFHVSLPSPVLHNSSPLRMRLSHSPIPNHYKLSAYNSSFPFFQINALSTILLRGSCKHGKSIPFVDSINSGMCLCTDLDSFPNESSMIHHISSKFLYLHLWGSNKHHPSLYACGINFHTYDYGILTKVNSCNSQTQHMFHQQINTLYWIIEILCL